MPAFQRNLQRFESLDAQVVGISIDHTFANTAWADSMGGITYPLLSDFWPHGEVIQKYGLFRDEAGMSERAVIIVDKQGIVQFLDVHDIAEQPDVEQCFEELAKLA